MKPLFGVLICFGWVWREPISRTTPSRNEAVVPSALAKATADKVGKLFSPARLTMSRKFFSNYSFSLIHLSNEFFKIYLS
jgi:hypothetical protein